MNDAQIPRRCYRTGIDLSIIGFGGMMMVGMEKNAASRIVAESIGRGVNYFDVAPLYGDGEAEKTMGPALAPYRKQVFLACKTWERSRQGAGKELDRSLRRLRTDHFDLYQFHGVSSLSDVNAIFERGGAMEAFLRAREQGKIRHIGFSAHSDGAALAMLEKFPFDSMLFPVNFICYTHGSFGPRVMEKAKELNVARLAIKAMAHGPWKKGEAKIYPNCWYRPIDNVDLARQALRFTLSEDVTAAIPPGDERLFRMALEAAGDLPPLTAQERGKLLAYARNLRLLFRTDL